ncbi:hypothetical protein LTR62_003912 [Meristemomyces frigidus]|uniref:Non-hemolytic phospholipase C n=1 Tax=Meristemomyces frigidus TaxID=1508187 RepID=A0AAN7THV1_9PEZI|nr:hypothetical protein LTR62_003912 [Meristemomyces frigidus]
MAVLASTSTAYAGSIADIEHVVLFMQENRAFDHYFGTMAGVRGFEDPNVQINNGTPVWCQNVNASVSEGATHLLPWYLNYLGGSWDQATQCMSGGSNGWQENHGALNGDLNNNWPIANTPWSLGYFTRKELPNHFAIAEGWTVGDMYQESVIASTNPNRVSWVSGSINAPGSPQSPSEGGIYVDNNETPGCESPGLNCYPLKWETTPEKYEQAGVSWQVYQDTDNFDDNPLAWFAQYQNAANGSAMQKKGMAYVGLEQFYGDAATGNLPQVSFVIGPAELSEHPGYMPQDGAWLQQKIVGVVTQSPTYNTTALITSYDESGGFADHVTPFHPPSAHQANGSRTPTVKPATPTRHADHNSQILFLEKWLAAKGHDVVTGEMAEWRRKNMADLSNAFDFDHPDFSVPGMPNASYPSTDGKGQWNGYAICEASYNTSRPPVPYGKQNASTSLATEQGFKPVRGQLTEGRYLTFESNGYALANLHGTIGASQATEGHEGKAQRFVVYEKKNSGKEFVVTSAVDGASISSSGALLGDTTTATVLIITDLGGCNGYTVRRADGRYLGIGLDGKVGWKEHQAVFGVFSVSYDG